MKALSLNPVSILKWSSIGPQRNAIITGLQIMTLDCILAWKLHNVA